jgi:hypothetical protein
MIQGRSRYKGDCGFSPSLRTASVFAVIQMPETTAEDKGAAHVTFLLKLLDEMRRKVPVGK